MNRLTLTCLISCSLLTCLTASASPDWPEAFSKAIAAPDNIQPVYSYEEAVLAKDGEEIYRVRFDPKAAKGQQFSLVSISNEWRDRADKILANYQDSDNDIWCDGLEDTINSDVTLAGSTDTTLSYSYKPTDPEADSTQKKIIEKSDATLTIDKASGHVRSIIYAVDKPFKPIFVAKVNSFRVETSCAPAPNGRPYMARIKIDYDVTALGKNQVDSTVNVIEKLTRVE